MKTKINSNALVNYALFVAILAFTAAIVYQTWFK
jgi:hypothetical protein